MADLHRSRNFNFTLPPPTQNLLHSKNRLGIKAQCIGVLNSYCFELGADKRFLRDTSFAHVADSTFPDADQLLGQGPCRSTSV